MFLRRLSPLAVALVAFVSVACGGQTQHRHSIGSAVKVVRFCSGLTDQCVVTQLRPTASLQSARNRIPDVSSFQGHPNWAAAKAAGIAGGIFKGGEYVVDSDAAFNNAQLRALHLWRAMYWFVRNTGCQHEAGQIISLAHVLGIVVVVNDLERPEARDYSACLVPAERNAHLIPVDYTAPGVWPGGAGFGNSPLWQAEYGPVLHPFWHPVIAWQCTDGIHGCVTFVPGIGVDDVSINLGFTKLGVAPIPAPKPKPKPLSKFGRLFNLGFQRGFVVARALRLHQHAPVWKVHIARADWRTVNFGFQNGFHAGLAA